MSESIATKVCRKCGTRKPAEAFAPSATCRDGRRGTCRKCRSTRATKVVTEKECNACGLVRPAEEYHRRAASSDGLFGTCKSCRAVEKAEYYRRNGEAHRQRRQAYYEANRERMIEAIAAWKRANPDKVKRYGRTYRERNPERVAQNAREWREANPEKWREILRANTRRRRARRLGATVGPVDLAALWTGTCALCDAPLNAALTYPHPLSKSVDHIVPLSKGGTHEQSNLQWAHLVCNNRKGASGATTPAADSPPRNKGESIGSAN